jgi:TIR domain
MKVFISHSSVDKWAARQICNELEQRGIGSFLDEKDIETGDSIDDAIDHHLDDCDELLMIVSPASLKSSWVLIEIGGARALKKRLIPILLHVGANQLPSALSRGLARDINEIDRYFDEAVARLNASKGPQSAQPVVMAPSPQVDLAPARDFEVGDLVRLPANIPETTFDRNGRKMGWNDEMTSLLGANTKVVGLESKFEGVVRVEADKGRWLWVMDWLTPAVPD